jgi:hypothetical protein
MKTIYKTLVISLCFSFLSLPSQAQTGLGFLSTQFSTTNVKIGDTLYVNTKIINYDSTAYSGSILQFDISINNILSPQVQLFSVPQIDSIPANDSIATSIGVIISSPDFITGPNVVIIWPKAQQTPPNDSIKTTIIVRDPNSINFIPSALITTHVRVKGNKLILENLPEDIALKDVRIVNQIGQIVYQKSDGISKTIPFENKPYGLYFVELILENKQRRVIKLPYFD